MKRKIIYLFVALALLFSLIAVAGTGTVAAAGNWYVDPLGTDDVSHGTGTGAAAFLTIQYAINDSRVVAGDTINVAAGTYVVSSQINLNKANLTLSGAGRASTIVQVSGTGERFYITATGVTIDGFGIQKTDKTGVQNIIYIGAHNTTITNNEVSGQYVIGDGDVSRAIVITGGLSGLNISGNTIHHLRQPAYISGVTTGTISNNYVYLTKGWVVEQGDMTFTSNTWGTGANANVYDIAILSSVGAGYYTDIPAMAAANNGAFIEDQRTSPATLSIVYVDGSVAASGDGTARSPKKTIAEGITRVVPGGTVYVAAGTYVENVSIPKSVTLKGAQYNVNVISRTAGSASESTIQGLVTVDASGVNINGFTLTNPSQTNALYVTPSHSNITITYNIVYIVGSVGLTDNVHAILLNQGPDSVTIAHNRFNNIKSGTKTVSAVGVLDSSSTDLSTGLVIQDNTFTDIASASKGAYGIIINNAAGAPGAQIKDNTFSGLNGGWTHAIGLEGPTPNAIVTGNIFSGLTAASEDKTAIFFEDNPNGGTVTVSGNQFNGTSFYGVAIHPDDLPGGSNGYNYTVIAENNWWGSASGPGPVGPGTGAKVSANVDYTPWTGMVTPTPTPTTPTPTPTTPTPTPTGKPGAGTSSSGGCFIATAAYGSSLENHVDTLRSFRDQYLETNPIGSAFVSLYYKVSPPMADFIEKHPTLKPIVRAELMPAVAMSSVALNTTLAEKAAILVAMALFTTVLIMWLMRRTRRSDWGR